MARRVEIQEIQEHGYNLNISRYIRKEQVESGLSVQDAIVQLKEKLELQAQAEERLEALLKKAGLDG